MQIADVCRDAVIVARRECPVRKAAQLMRRYHAGVLVIVDIREGEQVPVGVITDRDIVVEVVALGRSPADLTAGDIMTESLALAVEKDDIFETIERMRQQGLRRMPVVNDKGVLTGVVSLDDLLLIVAQELAGLGGLPLVAHQQEGEFRH